MGGFSMYPDRWSDLRLLRMGFTEYGARPGGFILEDKLNSLRQTPAWSEEENLPVFPKYDNPWIYLTYVMRLLGWDKSKEDFPPWFLTALAERFQKCEAFPGFVTRWPLQQAGFTSHDELMGACYISPEFTSRAERFLDVHSGLYSLDENPGEDTDIDRFIFMRPFMRASDDADYPVSLLSQAAFSAHLLWDLLFTHEGDVDGRLKIWLMLPAMSRYPLSNLALKFWAWRWTKRGWTPKRIFTEVYLKEYAFLGEWARSDWT